MSRRYTYARTIKTIEGIETFTAQEWDSFDEAKRVVDKGIHDRNIEIALKENKEKVNDPIVVQPVIKSPDNPTRDNSLTPGAAIPTKPSN